MYANHLGPDGTEHIKFPLTLQTLNLKNNFLGDTGAGNLRLPPNLKALHLGFNNIRSAGCAALRLPDGLERLNMVYNAPGNGVSCIRYPLRLLYLDISCNNIMSDVRHIVLPPHLLTLNVEGNDLTPDDVKAIVLPPSVQQIFTHYRCASESTLIEVARSTKGLRRYAPHQRYYDKLRLLPLYIELYRGLRFGHASNPTLQFVQSLSGLNTSRK